jgi:class 3 adenylate cyclase
MVAYWRSQGLEPEIVDTAALLGAEPVTGDLAEASPEDRTPFDVEPRSGSRQELAAVLLAEIDGSGKLSEEQFPSLIEEFTGAVAELAEESAHAPAAQKTWGVAFSFLFREVEDAGLFALELRDLVARTTWRERGLPEDLSIRLALHTGTFFFLQDPFTGRPDGVGLHTLRAARFKPITPSGCVYATQAFAALAAAEGITAYGCTYVGETPPVRGLGATATYHVERRTCEGGAAPPLKT